MSDETIRSMLKEGKDPKDLVIQACQPHCTYWKAKLERCEKALQTMTSLDPEKNCMYPMRDYVTCVEGCVQPKIIEHLVGHEKGFLS